MLDKRHSPAAKIVALADAASQLESSRRTGGVIVHCHGVFDLLHIGHIRHFQQARALGDVLVVTVTPDRFVGKGPGRPAFSERLRAEAVAALDCVDLVAINTWPMAVETISLLRPDYYVKGSEYRQTEQDRSGGIVLEREAVEAVGGELAFTDEITFSSSSLINQHVPIFSEAVQRYLDDFRGRYSEDEVLAPLEKALSLKVLVVGEAIIDEYEYCQAIGKSSKEPMLAVQKLSSETFAGGTLAVANHLANFCSCVGVVAFLGPEEDRRQFVEQKLHPAVDRHLLTRTSAPTIVKRRFVEHYFFTKLLEVYQMDDSALDAPEEELLCVTLEAQLPLYDLVVVVDFGHGMLGDKAIGELCRKAPFLAVNTQSNAGNLGYHAISRYPRADYVCLTENELRLEARDRRSDLKAMLEEVAARLACPHLIVTRGKFGCLCYSLGEGLVEVPALAGQVVDRVGAGDAFLALSSLCILQNVPVEVAGFIGNVVGAHAVSIVGNRDSINRAHLFKQIQTLLK